MPCILSCHIENCNLTLIRGILSVYRKAGVVTVELFWHKIQRHLTLECMEIAELNVCVWASLANNQLNYMYGVPF